MCVLLTIHAKSLECVQNKCCIGIALTVPTADCTYSGRTQGHNVHCDSHGNTAAAVGTLAPGCFTSPPQQEIWGANEIHTFLAGCTYIESLNGLYIVLQRVKGTFALAPD